jgi:hypothetical protein
VNETTSKTRKSPQETLRAVVQSEAALARRAIATQADGRWLEDVRGRLPPTWARVSSVALALDVSSATVRGWVEAGYVVAVDYAVRPERAAWNIYVPSVLEFLKTRQGGKQ